MPGKSSLKSDRRTRFRIIKSEPATDLKLDLSCSGQLNSYWLLLLDPAGFGHVMASGNAFLSLVTICQQDKHQLLLRIKGMHRYTQAPDVPFSQIRTQSSSIHDYPILKEAISTSHSALFAWQKCNSHGKSNRRQMLTLRTSQKN